MSMSNWLGPSIHFDVSGKWIKVEDDVHMRLFRSSPTVGGQGKGWDGFGDLWRCEWDRCQASSSVVRPTVYMSLSSYTQCLKN